MGQRHFACLTTEKTKHLFLIKQQCGVKTWCDIPSHWPRTKRAHPITFFFFFFFLSPMWTNPTCSNILLPEAKRFLPFICEVMQLPRNLICQEHESQRMSYLRPITPWIFIYIVLGLLYTSGPKTVIWFDGFSSMNLDISHCGGRIISPYIILQ